MRFTDMCRILFLVLIFLPLYLFGQNDSTRLDENSSEEYRLLFFEGGLSFSHPQSRFARNIGNDVRIGGTAVALYQLELYSPIFIGAEFNYTQLSRYRNSWDGTFDNGDPGFFEGSTSAHLMSLGALMRYYIPFSKWGVEPFIEGNFGLRWSYIYETTINYFDGEEDSRDSDFINSDFDIGYGGNLGFHIYASDFFYLTFKFGYHPVMSIEYGQEDENGIYIPTRNAYDIIQSGVDVLRWEIGLTYTY